MTILRKNNIQDAYNKLKELTRGKNITKEIIKEFINNLDINKEDKEILLNLTPNTYIGFANKVITTSARNKILDFIKEHEED